MRKNGYTLVELIAVIVIIALVATVVILNFDNSVDKSKNKKEDAFINDLEKAACVYIDLTENASFKATCYPSKSCNITVAQLVDSGILADDIIDPSTNSKINKQLTINVSWDANGTKTCSFHR